MDRVLVTLNFDSTQLTLPALSFCQATPAKLKEWVNQLPIANHGEAARQLYSALNDLNYLKCNATTRYHLLETILPITLQVSNTLTSTYLNKNISLTEQQRKIANITQAINNKLTSSYRLVVQQYIHDKSSSDKKFLAEAIYRNLQCASYSLLHSQQLYVSPADGFWLQFHDMFSLAEELKITTKKIKLEDSYVLHLDSIQAAYATTLLFYTCKPAQLRQSEQLAVYRALPNWSHFVSVHHPANPTDVFVIKLNENMPPIYQSFFKEALNADSAGLDVSSLVKGFNASGLIDRLKQKNPTDAPKKVMSNSVTLEIPSDIDHPLLTHLINTWGVIAIRSAERKQVEGTVKICVGLAAAHYYASDQTDFNAWSSQQKSLSDVADDDYTSSLASTQPDQEKKSTHDYAMISVTVINISSSGCCLQFKSPPSHLHSGEIIGIRRESGWRIGVIRWIQHVKSAGIQIGVEFLGSHVSPCGIKLLHASGETSAYMRTFLVSTNDLKTLITPRVPFKEGSNAYLKVGDTERRIHLSLLTAATGGFCQFKFNYINESTN